MTPNTTDTTRGSTEQAPSQLVPKDIESGIQVKGFLLRDLLYGLPGLLIAGIGWYVLLYWGAYYLGMAGLGLGVIICVAGIALSLTTDEYSTGIDRIKTAVEFARKQRVLPLSQEEAVAVHGVKRIHSDGSAETTDHRIVVLARLYGRNTDLQDESETRPMVGTLRQSIDEDITDFDFSIFSPSVPIDPTDVTDKYRQQWLSDSFVGSMWATARALLQNIIEWETHQQTEIWQTNERQHYLRVAVDPEEVDLPDFAVAEASLTWRERLTVLVHGPAAVEDQVRQRARRRRMRNEARKRLARVQQAFGSVTGVETTSVGPAEHALVLARFWSGVEHEFAPEQVSEAVNVSVWPHWTEATETDSHRPEAVEADEHVGPTAVASVEQIEAAADGGATADTATQPAATSTTAHDDPSETLDDEDAADASFLARVREGLFAPLRHGHDDSQERGDREVAESLNTDRIQDLLAPSTYDDRDDSDGGFVAVGEQYCRTYWIADFPETPREEFLKELYTMRGVTTDIHLRVQARDKDETMEAVKNKIENIDANIMEHREETDDLEALLMEGEMDGHMTYLKLLRHTDLQPWMVNMYVTVRAGTRRALDGVEELVEEGLIDESQLTLDVAKQQALEEACDDVVDALEHSPANLTPIADAKRQSELFRSASPSDLDAYAECSSRSRRRLTLAGTIAAAFPPTSKYINQDNGVEQGRSVTNGSVLTADAFEPGPGHKLAAGDSGAGKTVGILKQVVRWYLADPENRTLIFADTQAEFAGVTALLNGAHLTLDGTTTLNPFHMEPTPQNVLDTSGVDPFEMKHTQVVELLLDIVAASPEMRDRFRPLVEDAVRETMLEAGIKPRDPSTHTPENSPTMVDFRDMVEAIADAPEEYVNSVHVMAEIEKHAGALLHRLRGFTPDGKYSYLTGQSDASIDAGSVTYLDLQQLEGVGSATDSTMLNLALGQVYEAVKKAPGETIFVIDEAHYLLESKEMLEWLNKSSRHWRHNHAGLWFITQHPEDFTEDDDADKERHKDAIRGQANTTELYYSEKLSPTAASTFGLNDRQANFLRTTATAGGDKKGYTDCLVNYKEVEGWVRAQVRLSPLEKIIYSYDPREDGEFDAYLDREWGER